MFERNSLKTKLISAVASAALVVGLVPLPAFAATDNGGADAPASGGSTLLTIGSIAEGSGLQGIGAQSTEPVQVHSWTELQNAVSNAGNGAVIQLGGNIVNTEHKDRIKVEGSKSITIDLNGKTLNRNNSSVKDNGHVIEVFSGATLTIKDSSSTETSPGVGEPGTGMITGGYSKRGGGVYVNQGGTLKIESGTITGNHAKEYGGGIFVKGTLETTGGVVSANTAERTGGGIHLDPKGAVKLKNATVSGNQALKTGGGIELDQEANATIEGCKIASNRSGGNGGGLRMDTEGYTLTLNNTDFEHNSSGDDGAGIYLHWGTIEMNGGSLSENSSSYDAGGIKVTRKTTFMATGVTISKNHAETEEGGGVKNHGTTTLANCTINDNTAKNEGGGVYTNDDGDVESHLTVRSCTITDNTSESHGGGIYSGCNIALVGGGLTGVPVTITGNTAHKGGGVFIGSASERAEISGAIEMTGNTADYGKDLYLRQGRKLTLSNTITGTRIGDINMDELGVFTKNFGQYHPATYSGTNPTPIPENNPRNFFDTEAGAIPAQWATGSDEAELYGGWPELQRKIDATADGGTVTLDKDYTASSGDDRLQIRNNKSVTINLNGHTLNRNCSEKTKNGHVLEVFGGSTLTITDSSASGTNPGTGTITGGWPDRGGGIYVNENANLVIESGTIARNHSNKAGAGVYVLGSLTMTGGKIEGNHASESGGGIFAGAESSINLKDAVIVNNTAGDNGGGVNVKSQAGSIIADCEVAGNHADKNGGGVFQDADGKTLKITGSETEIDGNTTGDSGAGIYLSKGTIDMSSGSVSGNRANENGGGVHVEGGCTLIAEGVMFENNEAKGNEAGGIKNWGVTTLDGCAVSGNTAKLQGGGIYNDGRLGIYDGSYKRSAGTLTLTNCTVSDNSTASDGGGVYTNKKLTVDGGSYTGNTAQKGGGIYVGSDAETTEIQGAITARGNTAAYGKDVYLRKDKKLTLAGAISGTTIENMDMEKPGVFTIGYSDKQRLDEPSSFFNTDMNAIPVAFTADRTEAQMMSDWPALQALIDEAGQHSAGSPENTVKLIQGYRASAVDDRLIVSKSVTIDLNGLTLDRNNSSVKDDGHVLEVLAGATLTIKDDSAEQTGTITGGYSKWGGGIFVNEGGTLVIEGGTITGNHATERGGGVYVRGALNATGGSIEGNTSGENGGGVYLKHQADSTIAGCTIAENTSEDYGGGIYMDAQDMSLTISETDIRHNLSKGDGGGIYLQGGAIQMNGGSLSNNIASDGGGGAKITRETTFKATGVSICNNAAQNKAGGGVKSFGTTELARCTIGKNSAVKQGGGVCNGDYDSSEGKMTITGCTISGNTSDGNGGGVYSNKDLAIVGCSITGNSASKGGGVFIDQSASSTSVEGALSVADNTASLFGHNVFLCSGKKLTCTGTLAADATIGVDLEDGAGVLAKDYTAHNGTSIPDGRFVIARGYDLILNNDGDVELTSDWASIKSQVENAEDGATINLSKDYAACPSDDRIKVAEGKSVTVNLNGHALNRNRMSHKAGGCVFDVSGTLTLTDTSAEQTGAVMGGWTMAEKNGKESGGGIRVGRSGTLNLQGGTIAGNKAQANPLWTIVYGHKVDGYGGGIYVEGTLNMSGGAVTDNATNSSGGGIYVDEGGTLNLEGGTVTANSAVVRGGGITANANAQISVKGSPVVKRNSAELAGSDVYLPSGCKLHVAGALAEQALLSVSIENDWGIFTDGYSRYNDGENPARFFASSEGFTVIKDNGEAALGRNNGGETDDEKPFIDRDDQVNTDTDTLVSQNWMSGISGERYLHEINMPGSHDSGMRRVDALDWSMDLTAHLARWDPSLGAYYATTQTKYIDQQLAEGARQLDIRLNDCYKKKDSSGYYDWADDGMNLWICHGTNENIGTYHASNADGDYLSFDQVLDWVKDFLEKHPTETVILNLRWETILPEEHIDVIYKRALHILESSALQTNPSTGEPFLYKESGSDSYFAAYTHMPQLKDCRGKIVIQVQSGPFQEMIGGFRTDKMERLGIQYTDKSDYTLNDEEQIEAVTERYNALNPDRNSKPLPTQAGADATLDYLWYWELNCTGENYVWDTYVKPALSGIYDTGPLDFANNVDPGLIGKGKLFDERLNGQSIGWVRMDAFAAKYAEQIWRTNFSDSLQYCTVTVEPALNDSRYATQTYQVLKGTELTIPGNIYKPLESRHLDSWKAEGAGTDVTCKPGDTFRVNEDVTFKAQWLDEGQTPVSIVWKDGDDEDKLRARSVELSVRKDGSESSRVTLTADQRWSGVIEGDFDDVVPEWGLIKTDVDPHGQDVSGQYRYEANRGSGGEFVLTFYHTPQTKVAVSGAVSWVDDDDADGLRPDGATVRLLADGSDTGTTAVATEGSNWSYEFTGLDEYENAEKVRYSVAEDDISGYSAFINGFSITNTHVSSKQDVVNVTGVVEWDDANDVQGDRPEKIVVRLKGNGVEVGSQEVKPGEYGIWAFSFDEVPLRDSENQEISYSVVADEIAGYATDVESLGAYAFRITNTLIVDPADKKPAEVRDVPKACDPTYAGMAQALVSAGSCRGGTMMYALGADGTTAPGAEAFSAMLPSATDVGSYCVWYYVKGDALHTDTEPACVAAKIAKRPATIIVESASKVKGETDPIFTGTVEGLVADGDLGEVSYKRTNGDEAPGTYESVLTATYTANPNYDVSVAKGDFTITMPGYAVRFDSNVPANASTACSGSMDDESFAYDEKKALSANGYILPGYDFVGWNTKTDGMGTTYADGAEVQGLSEDGGTVVLYAQWSGKPYTIVFNPGEIGGAEHRQTAFFDQPGTLEAYSDSAFGWNSSGRTLHGWAGTGFGSFYGDGASFVNLCGAPDASGNVADVNLTADWVNNGQIVVTVTKDGVPQDGLADYLALVDESGTKFSVPISYENGKYTFDPTSASQPGGGAAQLPPGEYDLSFEAAGYPKATAHIVYGNDSASGAVFAYYTVSLAKDAAYADFNEVEISGGAPVAGEANTVLALDGDELGIKTTVGEGYRFAGYTAAGVAPVWEDGDPTKAEQTVEVRGKAAIAAHVSPKPRLTITPVAQTLTYNGQTQGPGDIVYDNPAEIAEKVEVEGLREGDALASVVLDGQGKDVGNYDLVASNAVVVNAAGRTVTDDYIITYEPGTLTIEALPAKKGTLTFDLGGGTIDGKTSLTIEANVGDVITIPEAPVRDGYAFKYWKGSEYYPGDEYTVEGDHAFTAVWEKKSDGGGSDSGGSSDSGGADTKGASSNTSGKSSTTKTGDELGSAVAALGAMAAFALCLALFAMRRRRRPGEEKLL